MKIVCYFADAKGGHQDATLADYDVLWRVMQESVERHGYELIHLTSLHEPARCAHVVRYNVDPETIMFSREVCWLQFLQAQPPGEQVVLVEPDCYLLKQIPPLAPDNDCLLLVRPGRPMPSGFRLATVRATPFYEAVVQHYMTLPHAKKVMHGDVDSIAAVLGVNRDDASNPPRSFGTVDFEHRPWTDYTSKLWRHAVAWNFKGWSKKTMLEMAAGKMPKMR